LRLAYYACDQQVAFTVALIRYMHSSHATLQRRLREC